MDRDDERPLRFGRRVMLQGSGAAGITLLLAGCDPGPLEPDAATPDAATPDAATPPMPDAGGGPLPPVPRTYATFEHGVASGDPTSSSVILWTHITPGMPGEPDPGSIVVEWEIADDASFARVVAGDTTSTDASRDFTVKVDAGGLGAGATYFYRFRARGDVSPIGRTRTAPEGEVDRLRFAMCSCSSLAHGFFHGYRQIARRADLDAVIHLGDYIYEYGTGSYGRVRAHEPSHDIVTLSDYRARYAQYRRDPDLAEAHRQHPFICVWDDHETADNSWLGGANNHDADQGPWAERLSAARRAYYEWLPVRDDAEGRLWRRLGYGALVDLVMLDTRIWGREEQGSEPDQLLGEDQEAWLFDQLEGSSARWKLIGQQVVMGQWAGFPNDDAWDGYPAARARLFSLLRERAIDDVVVLTGDVHSSWAMDLTEDPTDVAAYDPETGSGSLGVELVTPGITSPGFVGVLERAAQNVVSDNRHIHWANGDRRGYVVLDLTAERMQADWMHLADVTVADDDGEAHGVSFATDSGARHLVLQDAPVPTRSDAPPLAPAP